MRLILSLCLGVSLAAAQPQTPPSGPSPMELPEVRNYALSMDKVEKWAAASRAVIPYQKAHLDQVKKMPDPPADLPHTMDAMAKWTKAHFPEHTRLIEGAGITLREYLIIGLALPSALSIESAMERSQPIPPGTPVNQANVAFVKANKTKITAMFAEFQQLMAK